jgi:predicted SAM-dependent methyltransferase
MIIPAVSKPQLKISPGTREDIMKIVIGAGKTHYDGWIHTQEDELNLLNESSFLKYASQGSVDCFLAEHVWEHMTQDEGIQAARNCHKFLKPGGYLRVAVPDKNFRNDWYQNMVKVGGPGPADHPAADHKIVYDYRQFQEVFQSAGFKTQLLEYCDESGVFHYQYWNSEDGHIGRSFRYDTRNTTQELGMVSIIIDAHKELVIGE